MDSTVNKIRNQQQYITVTNFNETIFREYIILYISKQLFY